MYNHVKCSQNNRKIQIDKYPLAFQSLVIFKELFQNSGLYVYNLWGSPRGLIEGGLALHYFENNPPQKNFYSEKNWRYTFK